MKSFLKEALKRRKEKGSFSKTIKQLLAVVLGVQTIKFIEKELRLSISSRYMWTDSLCVFDWMKSSKPLKVWVEDRIKEIRKAKDITFRYVPSLENPADLATKGKLTNMNWELWWNGPKWLCQNSSFWPLLRRPEMNSSELQEIETEYKNTKHIFSLFVREPSREFVYPKLQEIVDVKNYSSLIPLCITSHGLDCTSSEKI